MAFFGPNDPVLEMLLARFRSILKPPDAVFTEKLPDKVEWDPFLIVFFMYVFTKIGYVCEDSIPHDIREIYHRALAIDFISAIKVDRPDIIHLCLQQGPSPPSFVQPKPSLQSPLQPEPSPLQFSLQPKPQFHHYIPRFILRTFADNFSFSKAQFITDTPNPGLSGFKLGRPSKHRRNDRPRCDINVYRVEDHTTNPTDVARAYGAEDMYRDVTEADCMKFEKLLSKLESTSAMFIRRILTDEQDLSLTRAQLADMKKFLIVMMYRSDHRRSQYSEQRFDPLTEMSIKKHMKYNDISNIQTVWFENLKWLIDTPAEGILEEFQKAMVMRGKSKVFTLSSPYQGPIHALELEDFGVMMTQSIACIWEAPAGSEFILSEGCFGSWEGDIGIHFHHIFIVSPRFAIVLVNRLYLESRTEKNPLWTSLFGDKLHVYPETIYKKGPPPKDLDPMTHFTLDDVFKYKRIVIAKEDVYKVNGILLDARRQCLTYKSKASMYKSLRYYDKVKWTMFHDCHDYSILRRKLFADLNRTHPVDQ